MKDKGKNNSLELEYEKDYEDIPNGVSYNVPRYFEWARFFPFKARDLNWPAFSHMQRK